MPLNVSWGRWSTAAPCVSYKMILEPLRRTIVVGDIHGCWDEFTQLLALVGFSKDDDLLVTVGDFLDRGPESWAVARFIRSTPTAFSVMGNHERRVAGVIRGRSHPAWSQRQSLSLLPKGERDDWAGWLEDLPAVLETQHVLVTHARLDPSIAPFEQDAHFTAAVGGSSVSIERDSDGVPLWFRQVVFEKPVCMGHIGYDRVVLVPNGLYALDTRAVYGGQLTAAVFPGGEIFQIPVPRNYHQESYRAWRMSQLACSGDPMSWPLAQVLKMLNAREDDKDELEREIALLDAVVSGLTIGEHGRALHEALVRRFGEMPPPGPERGAHFKSVKVALRDWGMRTLALRLLKGAPMEFKDLAAAFPKMPLNGVKETLSKAEIVFSDLR